MLPVGVVFVPLRVKGQCWFGLVCSAEGLFQEPKEVCALGVWPLHSLQCGGLGGSVGDRGLVEDVDAGVCIRGRWLLGMSGRGGGPFLARAPSGVERVDDTLSCRRLAAPLLCISPVYSVPVRYSVSGAHSCMGTMSRLFWSRQSSMVCPTFSSLWVAGSHWTWILNLWWSPVTRH